MVIVMTMDITLMLTIMMMIKMMNADIMRNNWHNDETLAQKCWCIHLIPHQQMTTSSSAGPQSDFWNYNSP